MNEDLRRLRIIRCSRRPWRLPPFAFTCARTFA